MTNFQGVVPALNQALIKRGYTELTSVQEAVLAPNISASDLLVSAQTGSGKTVAFGLALAPTLLNGADAFTATKVPLALVIAPTRELALQVTRELEWLYQMSGASVASCVGGMDIRSERDALKRGPHIVVGTPGRLCDHIKRGSLDTSKLRAVVLDEADEMLDMGFREELQYILETSPKERRTLMFSATVPKSIASLAKQYQNDAKRITTKEEEKQHVDIEYQAFSIAPSDRENAIINLLRYYAANNAIIFCGTRMEVNHLTSRLTNRGFSVVALSGELSQSERSHALQALRDGRAKVCVATDVASRGIDLPGLALVIHADIPKNSDILLHRSGRTGRAGSKGVSAMVVPHNRRSKVEKLLQNAKIKANWGNPPSIKDILERDRERFFTDPALNDAIKDEEKSGVQELISRFAPEQLAVALLRMHNAQKPAPEELLDAPSFEAPKQNREGFKDSVWISLSIGHNMSAEPRWLLPMLCGAGNITKQKIGAIKVQQTETYVELTADCIDDFIAAIGPSGKVEKGIRVTRLNGVPEMSRGDYAKPKRPDNYSNKKHHRGPKPGEGAGSDFKRQDNYSKKKTHQGPKSTENTGSDFKRPFKNDRDDRTSNDGKSGIGEKPKTGFKMKSKANFSNKSKDRKPFKAGFSKDNAKRK